MLFNEDFRRNKLCVLIDEVHCVSQWATFRKEYAKLDIFRTQLPPSTIAFGASATLDPETFKKISSSAGFRNPIFIETTTDRPEIYLEIRSFQANLSSFEDLRFLFPDKLTSKDIPTLEKTMVYFDSKQDIRLSLKWCRMWLRMAGLSPVETRQAVQP